MDRKPSHRLSDDWRRLRQALLDLCYEREYPNVTLAALLERAKVDEPTFKRHFATLDDFVLDVYESELDNFYRCLDEALAGKDSWRERLRITAYIFFEYLIEDRPRAHFVTVAVRSADERVLRLMGSAVQSQVDLLDQGRGERDDPNGISRATAEAVGGAIFNHIYAWVAGGAEPGDAAKAVPQALYTAVLPYLGEEAAREELRIPPPRVRS